MFRTLVLFAIFCHVASQKYPRKCPTGGEIYETGITAQGVVDVINAHNGRRLEIAQGKVPGQPRGINLMKMVYDKKLGRKGRIISKTCTMAHIEVTDARWNAVGQNLYIYRSSKYTTGQDWNRAITAWFNEYRDFEYPTTSRNKTGHYRQVVWAETSYVGCDFISFYDTTRPRTPYAKLYTCNYGPPGNYKGEAPYKTGRSGCEKLCEHY